MAMIQSSTMINRVIRAARLEPGVYEEAEHNPALQSEAITVVALAAVLSGLGVFLAAIIAGAGAGAALLDLIIQLVVMLIRFFIWAGIAYLVGTRVFGGTADYGELVRTLGYAYGPNALGLFIFLPLIGWLIALAGSVWAIITGVIAVRQALDFDTGKAVLTVLVGWVVGVLLALLVAGLFMLGTSATGMPM